MAHVLVVEDDQRVAAEIGSALMEYGFLVDEASNGSIGLRKAMMGTSTSSSSIACFRRSMASPY